MEGGREGALGSARPSAIGGCVGAVRPAPPCGALRRLGRNAAAVALSAAWEAPRPATRTQCCAVSFC